MVDIVLSYIKEYWYIGLGVYFIYLMIQQDKKELQKALDDYQISKIRYFNLKHKLDKVNKDYPILENDLTNLEIINANKKRTKKHRRH